MISEKNAPRLLGAMTKEALSMTNLIEDVQPRTMARIARFLYLSFIIFMAIANVVGRVGIIVDGDAAATAANIIAKGMRFRIGFVSDLLR
jgi:hypothetical protein